MTKVQRNNIGDYFTLQRGTTYQSRLLGLPGPILLGLASIQRNGGFRSDSLQTYGGECPEKIAVRPGDLYVSLKDVTQSADLLGAVARLPREYPLGRLTQDTVKLVPKDGNVPFDYLYWLLHTPQYRDYCQSHATGTTNLGLSREDFLSYPAPEPNSEQLKLAETLGYLDDKIELNRRMNTTLEAIARTLFQSWFVDFDPVRAKSEGRQPEGMDAETAALFPDAFEASELGPIPAGWNFDQIRKITNLQNGFAFKSKDWTDSGIPVVKIGSVKPGVVDLEQVSYVSNEVAQLAKRFQLQQGDLLIGMTGYVGEVGIVPQTDNPPLLNQRVGKFLLPEPGTSRLGFIYCLTRENDFKKSVSRNSHGSAQANVSADGILSIKSVLPTENVRKAFDSMCQPFFDLILANLQESRTLSAMRDVLLPELVSGQARVSDMEEMKWKEIIA